jgi:hypothetical protein
MRYGKFLAQAMAALLAPQVPYSLVECSIGFGPTKAWIVES